jgi:hypothetical protein
VSSTSGVSGAVLVCWKIDKDSGAGNSNVGKAVLKEAVLNIKR